MSESIDSVSQRNFNNISNLAKIEAIVEIMQNIVDSHLLPGIKYEEFFSVLNLFRKWHGKIGGEVCVQRKEKNE